VADRPPAVAGNLQVEAPDVVEIERSGRPSLSYPVSAFGSAARMIPTLARQ
jgi:hypothetical protein